MTLTERWEAGSRGSGARTTDEPTSDSDPFTLRLPALLLANKAEGVAVAAAELDALRDLSGLRLPALAVSATTGLNLGQIGPWLFAHLGVVRVYTKVPGHAADKGRPFTLRRGQTIGDVARLVHRDLGHSLRYARIWGPFRLRRAARGAGARSRGWRYRRAACVTDC
ncbi:MAG TPA: TGS domain-containing protein [Burkholderiaceae bacterium]|nr:TGS domain-containing protein [Burkholderiaceae bacterium]